MEKKLNKYFFLLLLFSVFCGIKFSEGTTIDFFRIMIIVSSLYVTLKRKKRAGDVYFSLLQKAIVIFVFSILITMLIRGSGMKILGSEQWGGGAYIVLIFASLLTINAHKFNIDSKSLNLGIVLFLVGGLIPFLNELLISFDMKFVLSNYIQSVFTENTQPGYFTRLQTGGPFALNLFALAFLYNKYKSSNLKFITIMVISFIIAGLSGHRLALINIIMFTLLYYYLNNKLKYKLAPILAFSFIILGLLYTYSEILPLTFQRMIAFIPGIKISYIVSNDVVGSTEWRLKIWEYLLEQIKQYIIIGQGLTFSSYELNYLQNYDKSGILAAILARNYHNGPLSMIIVFGILGIITLLLLTIYSIKLIFLIKHNMTDKLKDKSLFLVFSSYFITYYLTFLFFYGDLNRMLPLIFTQIAVLRLIHINYIQSYENTTR